MKNNTAGTAYSHSVIIIICLLVCLTPLVRGGAPLWTKTMIQLLTVAGLILLALESAFTKIRVKPTSSLTLPLAVLALLTLVTTLCSDQIRLSLEGMAMFYTYLAIYFLTIAAVRTRQDQRLLIGVIFLTAMMLSIFGLFKRFGSNPFNAWEYTAWYPGIPLNSVYPNHNHMAGLLEMVIPLLLVFSVLTRRSRSWRIFLIYLSLILLLAHLLTLSRGGWISLAGAIVFLMIMAFRKKRMPVRWLTAMIVVWLTAMLFVFSFTPVSERVMTMAEGDPVLKIRDRISIWQGVLKMIADHPLVGTGPGTFAHRFPGYQPPGFAHLFTMAHNDYLHFIAETGLLLLPLLVWLVYCFFKRGFYLSGLKNSRTEGLAMGIMAVAVAVMLHGLCDFNLHIPANALIFTVLCANLEINFQYPGEPRK